MTQVLLLRTCHSLAGWFEMEQVIQAQPIRGGLETLTRVIGNWERSPLSHWAESGVPGPPQGRLVRREAIKEEGGNQRQRPNIVQGAWIKPHLKVDSELSI